MMRRWPSCRRFRTDECHPVFGRPPRCPLMPGGWLGPVGGSSRQHRVSTLKLVDSVDEQETLEDLIQATKPALPPECQHLHYLQSTPFRYGAVYPRAPVSSGRADGRRVLCCRSTGDRCRRNGILSSALLCRIAGHSLAVQCRRIHRIFSRVRDPEGDRSQQGQIHQRQSPLEASQRLRGLPRLCRYCSQCRDRGHPLRLSTRSATGHERRVADRPGLRQTQTVKPADLAYTSQRRRSACDLRVTAIPCDV